MALYRPSKQKTPIPHKVIQIAHATVILQICSYRGSNSMQYMCIYIYMYTWNLVVLYFGASTLHNKVFSSSNMGHLGSRHTRICIDIDSLGRAFQHTHTQNHQCLNKNSTHVKPTKYIQMYKLLLCKLQIQQQSVFCSIGFPSEMPQVEKSQGINVGPRRFSWLESWTKSS